MDKVCAVPCSVSLLVKNTNKGGGLKGGVKQGVVKGNAQEIFESITREGQMLESGAVKLENGTIVNLHNSTKAAQIPTIDINKGDKIYKIRVEE